MNKQSVSKAEIARFVSIINGAHKLNLSDPRHLEQAKKILSLARTLQPKGEMIDPATNQYVYPGLKAAIENYIGGIGARPDVAGIGQTRVQGPHAPTANKWELKTSSLKSYKWRR